MKQITFNRLIATNFKGKSFDIALTNNFSIYAENGKGKTSVIDSIYWLFTGKDSLNRTDMGKGSFDIKPLDENNNVIHNLDITVFLSMYIDGEEFTLERVLSEKWKSVDNEDKLVGHESKFKINGSPVNKTEYEKQITDNICKIEDIRLIIDPKHFNSIDKSKSRQILLEFSGEKRTDFEIASSVPDYSELAVLIKNKSINMLKTEVSAKITALDKSIKENTTRINENLATMPEMPDVLSLKSKINILDFQKVDVEVKIKDAASPEQQVQMKKSEINSKIIALKTANSTIEYKTREELTLDANRLSILKTKKQSELVALKQTLDSFLKEKAELPDKINDKQEYVDLLMNDYKETNSLSFSTNIICPYSKIACTVESVVNSEKDKLEANFNTEKNAKIASIVEKGKKANGELEVLKQRAITIESDITEINSKISYLEKEIVNIVIPDVDKAVIESVNKNDDYISNIEKINTFENEISSLVVEPVDISELESKLAEINSSIESAKKELSVVDTIKEKNTRIEQLKAENKTNGVEKSRLSSILKLIKSFLMFKTSLFEEPINNKLENIKFRFFREQLNGEFEEVCDAVVDGVPWATVNNGGQVKAGVEIITKILQPYLGVNLPILIDNKESVTSLPETTSQVIQTVVLKDESMSEDKETRDLYFAFTAKVKKENNLVL